MWRHAFKLAWRRKRASALLIAEFAAVFLVLTAVATLGLYYAANARQSVGFSADRVWRMSIEPGGSGDDAWTPEQTLRFARALDVARSLPYVEAVGGIEMSPYDFSSSTGAFEQRERTFEYGRNEATDGFADALGLWQILILWQNEKFYNKSIGGAILTSLVILAICLLWFGYILLRKIIDRSLN